MKKRIFVHCPSKMTPIFLNISLVSFHSFLPPILALLLNSTFDGFHCVWIHCDVYLTARRLNLRKICCRSFILLYVFIDTMIERDECLLIQWNYFREQCTFARHLFREQMNYYPYKVHFTRP